MVGRLALVFELVNKWPILGRMVSCASEDGGDRDEFFTFPSETEAGHIAITAIIPVPCTKHSHVLTNTNKKMTPNKAARFYSEWGGNASACHCLLCISARKPCTALVTCGNVNFSNGGAEPCMAATCQSQLNVLRHRHVQSFRKSWSMARAVTHYLIAKPFKMLVIVQGSFELGLFI